MVQLRTNLKGLLSFVRRWGNGQKEARTPESKQGPSRAQARPQPGSMRGPDAV